MHRIVIVGAGPAGTRAADRLAGRGFAVTLVGAEPEAPYDRVALSKFLAGEISEADLMTHETGSLKQSGVTHRSGTKVIAIDREQSRVWTDNRGAIGYDRLVLALGSTPVRLPFPGADLPGVVMYRTLDDVRRMIGTAAARGHAVVIGGGLLGLEAAYGLAMRGMKVFVLHAVDRLMERQLDHAAANLLAQRLARHDISVHLTAKTEAIVGDTFVTGVRLADGTVLPADLVVMAVGIRPETALAKAAGLGVRRGIVVDDTMASSDPKILAIGECAEHDGVVCGLVAPAYAQAEIAAWAIAGALFGYKPETDATALKVAGTGVWSAGEIDRPDAETIVYDDTESGEYRKLLLRDDRLVGAMLFGDTSDGPWYQSLITGARPLRATRAALPFGAAFAPALSIQD